MQVKGAADDFSLKEVKADIIKKTSGVTEGLDLADCHKYYKTTEESNHNFDRAATIATDGVDNLKIESVWDHLWVGHHASFPISGKVASNEWTAAIIYVMMSAAAGANYFHFHNLFANTIKTFTPGVADNLY